MPAFVDNTNVLDLIGLKSEIEDQFINDAVVTVTIKDAAGEEVLGATWPMPMIYVVSSNGDYRSILTDELILAPGASHTAVIHAVGSGPDRVGHWEFIFKPKTRTVKDA